ncbi:MAG: DsbA family protein [Pseudomonadota bacterium]
MLYLVEARRFFRHILFFSLLLLTAYGCGKTDEEATFDASRLPTRLLGNPEAAVTIVVFASLTCPHCAKFEVETLPLLKAKYIDTGKVRLLYRNFPLDNLAHKAAMLADCTPKDNYFNFLTLLFSRQRSWAESADPRAALASLAKMVGMDEKTYDACLNDSTLADTILKERLYGEKAYKVRSTPTFIIDGEKHVGDMLIEDFDKILAPLLKKAEAA